MSEADDEHEDDEESLTPQSEQDYREMVVPVSEFYKDYDEENDEDTMAVMTVFPMKETPDIIAASNIGLKPKGLTEKDNWNFWI